MSVHESTESKLSVDSEASGHQMLDAGHYIERIEQIGGALSGDAALGKSRL
ncbi:MAG: hypothetical protein ABGX04_07190 [Myxococcales bacterium]